MVGIPFTPICGGACGGICPFCTGAFYQYIKSLAFYMWGTVASAFASLMIIFKEQAKELKTKIINFDKRLYFTFKDHT